MLKKPVYNRFWLKEVKAIDVPYTRLTGLIEFYQLQHKPTHCNAIDSLHSNHLLDCDIFITADKDFYKVLFSVSQKLSLSAKPVLINRAATSALQEITKVLTKL